MAEHGFRKAGVVGSTPTVGFSLGRKFRTSRGVSNYRFNFARSASTDSTPAGSFASSINITGIPSRTG